MKFDTSRGGLLNVAPRWQSEVSSMAFEEPYSLTWIDSHVFPVKHESMKPIEVRTCNKE